MANQERAKRRGLYKSFIIGRAFRDGHLGTTAGQPPRRDMHIDRAAIHRLVSQPMPHWQGNFPVTLNMNNHNFRVIARYRDSLNEAAEDLSANEASVFVRDDPQITVDLNWTYAFNQGSSIALSVNNAFASDPPEQNGARFDRRRREFGLQFRHSFDN